MKVESKIRGPLSGRPDGLEIQKAGSRASAIRSATARTGGGRSRKSSQQQAFHTEATPQPSASKNENKSPNFDPTRHHALRYNIRGFPMELRPEKAGAQNGSILKQEISKYHTSLTQPICLLTGFPQAWLDPENRKTLVVKLNKHLSNPVIKTANRAAFTKITEKGASPSIFYNAKAQRNLESAQRVAAAG